MTRGTPSGKISGRNPPLFQTPAGVFPQSCGVVAPQGLARGSTQKTHDSSASDLTAHSPGLLVSPQRDSMDPPGESDAPSLDQDREMLQALLTQAAIEALILRLEETHRREIQEVKGVVSTLTDGVASGEVSMTSLETRVSELERARDQHRDTAVSLEMHLEDIEDRSHRNNLRLRGIPEASEAKNVSEAVRVIFWTVLDDPEADVVLDKAHRALGPSPADPSRARDVVCRLHRYTQKENILRQAWEQGNIEMGGSQIRILPDLSRVTLRQQSIATSPAGSG